MKKLSLLPIILLLVACQPSELERCIAVNTEPVSLDSYVDKVFEYHQNLIDFYKAIETPEYFENIPFEDYERVAMEDEVKLGEEFVKNLNIYEKVIDDCEIESFADLSYGDRIEHFNRNELTDEVTININYVEDLKSRVNTCIASNIDELNKLIPIVELEKKEDAKAICNAQGVY
jgi:hypothetical protein